MCTKHYHLELNQSYLESDMIENNSLVSTWALPSLPESRNKFNYVYGLAGLIEDVVLIRFGTCLIL